LGRALDAIALVSSDEGDVRCEGGVAPGFSRSPTRRHLLRQLKSELLGRALNRRFASFFGANSNNLINRDDKNFSVAYLFGTSRSDDSFDGPLNPYVR
jgi:hypothetical protein